MCVRDCAIFFARVTVCIGTFVCVCVAEQKTARENANYKHKKKYHARYPNSREIDKTHIWKRHTHKHTHTHEKRKQKYNVIIFAHTNHSSTESQPTFVDRQHCRPFFQLGSGPCIGLGWFLCVWSCFITPVVFPSGSDNNHAQRIIRWPIQASPYTVIET